MIDISGEGGGEGHSSEIGVSINCPDKKFLSFYCWVHSTGPRNKSLKINLASRNQNLFIETKLKRDLLRIIGQLFPQRCNVFDTILFQDSHAYSNCTCTKVCLHGNIKVYFFLISALTDAERPPAASTPYPGYKDEATPPHLLIPYPSLPAKPCQRCPSPHGTTLVTEEPTSSPITVATPTEHFGPHPHIKHPIQHHSTTTPPTLGAPGGREGDGGYYTNSSRPHRAAGVTRTADRSDPVADGHHWYFLTIITQSMENLMVIYIFSSST